MQLSVLAISDGDLYTMDFKNDDAWESYTDAVDNLITKYGW